MSSCNHKKRPCVSDSVNPLTVEECRKIMGWHDRSDEEIAEFLGGLRVFLGRFLDDYYRDEFSID